MFQSSYALKLKPQIEGALLAAIAVILGAFSVYLPIIGQYVLIFFCPVPIILTILRHNIKLGFSVILVAFVLMGIITGIIQAILLVILYNFVGIGIGVALKRGLAAKEIILVGSFLSLAGSIIELCLLPFIMGINPWKDTLQILDQSLQTTAGIYEKLSIDKETITKIKIQMEESIKQIKLLLPAILLAASIFYTLMVYLATQLVLIRLGYSVPPLPKFSCWKLPWYCIWGIILGLFLSLWSLPLIRITGINMLVSFIILYGIQGFAIIFYFFNKYNIPKVLKVISVIILFQFLNLIALVGIIDTWFDFRKLERRTAV